MLSKSFTRTLLGAALSVSVITTACAAGFSEVVGNSGRWLRDKDDRVVLLHGVNVANKKPPYEPSAMGFDADDADALAREGFNTVRLAMYWKAIEPQPGIYDDQYLDKVQATVALLASRGIHTLLDVHQDMAHEKYGGLGFPDWAILDDGVPLGANLGFPFNYYTMPAMMRVWDNFLANKAGPGGVGLQDRLAAAWLHVASRMKGERGLLGYDLLNEPAPGREVTRCTSLNYLTGCPRQDAALAAMFQRVQEAIRTVDKRTMVFWEPYFQHGTGARTWLRPAGDNTGLSFHPYCLTQAVGGSVNVGPVLGLGLQAFCGAQEQWVMTQAEHNAKPGGAALLITEFGATDDLKDLLGMVRLADKNMLSWQYWAWYNADFGAERKQDRLILDISKPPTSDNLAQAKLNILVRPYPTRVAGTPVSWAFNDSQRHFVFEYRTQGVTGKAMAAHETEVFVPRRHFPAGYQATVSGGVITSPPGAEHLTIKALPGADHVRVELRP